MKGLLSQLKVTALRRLSLSQGKKITRSTSRSELASNAADTPMHGNAQYYQAFESISLISMMAPATYKSQPISIFIQSTTLLDLLLNFLSYSLWQAKHFKQATFSKALLRAFRTASIFHFARRVSDNLLFENFRRICRKASLPLNTALRVPEKVSLLIRLVPWVFCPSLISSVARKRSDGFDMLIALATQHIHETLIDIDRVSAVFYSPWDLIIEFWNA